MKHSDSDKIQAPEGQGCPKCGGYVYHADQVRLNKKMWETTAC